LSPLCSAAHLSLLACLLVCCLPLSAAAPGALRIVQQPGASGTEGQPGTVAAGGLAITCSFTHAELVKGPGEGTRLVSSANGSSAASLGGGRRPEQPPSGSLTPLGKPAASAASSSASSNGATDTVTLSCSLSPGLLATGLPRQLEAVLLSNSPRMLVIDSFFDPGVFRFRASNVNSLATMFALLQMHTRAAEPETPPPPTHTYTHAPRPCINSTALCHGLMELARDKLVRSRVASGGDGARC
jgi:hypothetical protein